MKAPPEPLRALFPLRVINAYDKVGSPRIASSLAHSLDVAEGLPTV